MEEQKQIAERERKEMEEKLKREQEERAQEERLERKKVNHFFYIFILTRREVKRGR